MNNFERVELSNGWVKDDGTIAKVSLYQIEGVDRLLSMGELVMALCLSRATELEASIIEMMEKSAGTTRVLENLTAIQNGLVNALAAGVTSLPSSTSTLNKYLPEGSKLDVHEIGGDWVSYLTDTVGITLTPGTQYGYSADELSEIVSDMSSAMDSLNSVGQEDLIELQALTNRRDETYNLISNVIKSLNTTLVGNANNL